MKRLRVALVLLFVALALPVGVLVTRALQSAELERRIRYDAVSERVFDEMERTLSDFLAREEARPPGEYHFYRPRPDGRPSTQRSPLSRPPAEPFVIAHFQIAPDGSLHTPLRPADLAAAERAGDWPVTPAERDRIEGGIAALEREVGPFWRDAEMRRRASKDLADVADRGQQETTLEEKASNGPPPLAKLKLEVPDAADAKSATAPKGADRDPASAYELLQSLNVGAKKRAERREQIVEAETDAYASSPSPTPPPAPRASIRPERLAQSEAVTRPEPHAERAAPRVKESVLHSNAADESPTRPPAAAHVTDSVATGALGRRLDRSAERARVSLEPMTGRPIGDRYLLLYRTVVIDGEGFRQGLLIDRAELGRWLADQVIGAGPLAGLASVRFDGNAEAVPDHEPHIAAHAFAEPFSGLEAELRVSPLGDPESATTIHLLAALLAIVAVLGLAAVYRMASVVVDFAERRSNFVAAVSHELKTPLTAIRMHGEMLRDGLVADESRRSDYYRTITDESERLSRLIDNVLEFSRLDKGGRALAIVVGSPAPIVTDILERLRPHAERAGFTLTAEIADPLPVVRFDRDALIQMVFNLVDNAIKYSARSERREIVVRCTASEGGGVALCVRDFGPGVPQEHLSRVFEPFHRVEDELTRSTKGSGIGLSLVKQLGEAMGASVRGDNPEGGGFEVRIGLAPARAT